MSSYVLAHNEVFRFDSNYFQKEFLLDEDLIRSKHSKSLKALGVNLLSFGAYSLTNSVSYKESGVPFIRGINMKNGTIDFSDMMFIDNEANKLLWKSEVLPETVLLSMSGTIGDVAIASKNWTYPVNANQDIAKVHTDGTIDPYYLYIFFLSKFGQNYLRREARGSVQQHVFLSQIEQFEIPILSNEFIGLVREHVLKQEQYLSSSIFKYKQAEILLLETLGLQDFEPSQEPVNIKGFNESFGATGRLDAEYYQVKYEQVEQKIRLYKGGFSNLGNVLGSISTGEYSSSYETKSKDKVYYLRNTNIAKGLLTPDERYAVDSRKFTTSAQKGEILTSRVGTIGLFGVVTDDLVGSIYSDNVLCLRLVEYLDPTVYSILLSTEPFQLLLEKLAGGSVQPLITQTTIKTLVVPILDDSVQQNVASLVQESFDLKKQSEHLLEVAKRGVEIAIEEDEAEALAFFERKKHS